MELTNEFTVDVPLARAWAVLTDVELIAPCLPGAQLQEIEGDEYRGIVKVKVGPITAQYKGAATFVEQDEAAGRVVLEGKGRDTKGQGNASAVITAQLTAAGPDRTTVSVVTDLTVTGKVAQFGRGVMADVSSKLMAQFADNLSAQVLVPSAAEPAAEPAPAGEATPPQPPPLPESASVSESASVPEPPPLPEAAPASGAAPDAATPGEPEPGVPVHTNGSTSTPATATVRRIDQPEAEAIDLVGTAGGSLLKRALPLLAVGAVLLLVARALRRKG